MLFYRALLYLYPAYFRHEYGSELIHAFAALVKLAQESLPAKAEGTAA